MRNLILLLLLLFFTASTTLVHTPRNYHQVSDSLFRSGQPQRKSMKDLEKKGFKTILNLRNVMDDKQEIKGTQLRQIRVPMQAKKITHADILHTLQVIQASEKPILIHCLHGSDRTGAVCAAYRMVIQNWSKEKAINEFLDKKYGYNKGWFPNIISFLKELDVEKLRMELK